MTTIPAQNFGSSYSGKALCRIVGAACLAGFMLDILTIAFPPSITNIAWRISFLQQVGDRSIVLLFGMALMMYGVLDTRLLRKRFAFFCLALGVVFGLSSILVITDSVRFREQAVNTISSQAATLQTQIQQAKTNPPANANITPELIQKASQEVTSRAESAKQSTQANILKTSVSSIGNLIIVGLALVGLGQYGARPSRS